MKELKITAADVESPEAGVHWLHSCLDQLGAVVDWNDKTQKIPTEWNTVINDLMPLFYRLQDFMSVCPDGMGIISVAADCNPIHVAGVVWTKGEKA